MIEQTARIISELVDRKWSVSIVPSTEEIHRGLEVGVITIGISRGQMGLLGSGRDIDMATADLVGQIRKLMQQLQEVGHVD
jgi:hypothetical protein